MGCDTNNRVIGEFEKLIEKHITEGDSREHSGDYVNAAVDFETALLYLTQVFKLCSDENTKHRISMLYNQLAHAHALSGNAELALVFYGKSLSLRKEMYGDNPSAENCLDVSFCYDRIARMYEKQDRFSEAVLSFGQSFRWVRRAKGMIAENEFEHIRCSVLNRIANVLAETGKYRSALIKYEKSYNICKRMYEENPSGQTAHDLFVCVFNIAELMRMCGDCVDSYIWFCYGKELLEKNLDAFRQKTFHGLESVIHIHQLFSPDSDKFVKALFHFRPDDENHLFEACFFCVVQRIIQNHLSRVVNGRDLFVSAES